MKVEFRRPVPVRGVPLPHVRPRRRNNLEHKLSSEDGGYAGVEGYPGRSVPVTSSPNFSHTDRSVDLMFRAPERLHPQDRGRRNWPGPRARRTGEADVILAHVPEVEKRYVAEGKMLNRRLVMYSDFVIIGPADDLAEIRNMTSAARAMKAIAQAGSHFSSRADKSGAHILGKALLKLATLKNSNAR